jgi:CheY-like chemotaxis protein
LAGKRVLLVEDNASQRQLLSRLLSAWGMEVTCCALAAEAQAAVRTRPFDLALLDATLPDRDGLTLAADLQTAQPRLLPLVLTGRNFISTADPLPTLAKPVKASQLRKLLLGLVGEKAPSSLSSSPAAPPSIWDATLASRYPLQILVAEDNPVNQKVIRLMLERLGYRPDIVGNGLEAVQALRLRPYDLVLMDMQMPELDGLAATRRIRAELPPERQPRIVVLTANVFSEGRAAAEAAGVDGYLTKPLEPAALVRVLQGSLPLPKPASQEEDPPLDPVILAQMRAVFSSPEAWQEMIQTYRQDSEALLGSLRQALEQRDPQAIARLAHRLKGSSSTLGAKRLAELCQQLEKLVHAEPASSVKWDTIEQALQKLEVAYRQVILSLIHLR